MASCKWKNEVLLAICFIFVVISTFVWKHSTDGITKLAAEAFLLMHGQEQVVDHAKVAICLVGGARSFELTGPSINKQVLGRYPHADVFLHAPLDSDTFKLFLLNNSTSHLAALRIFSQATIQDKSFYHVLSPDYQHLLQYFNLVEGCVGLIRSHEKKHSFKYDWIVRIRLDSYWSGPLPSVETFNKSVYTIPLGSKYIGLNDRFGIGTRNNSLVALSRLSSLEEMDKRGYRGLNSEGAFKAQFDMANVSYNSTGIPFCVLTSKKFGWPIGTTDHPVMAISSKGPLNGAYCKPCIPSLVGEAAKEASERLEKEWSWIGPNEGVEICDNSDWKDETFDHIAGEEARGFRILVANLTRDECLVNVGVFQSKWELWDAPSPQVICSGRFGPPA